MTLATLAPNAARSGRVRATCVRRLERTRRRSDRLTAGGRIGRRIVASLAALAGVAYVASLVGVALQTLASRM